MSPQEDQAFIDLIKSVAKPGIVVCEVGCWQGELTVKYGPLVKENEGYIILVDWWKGNINAGDLTHQYNPVEQDNIYRNLVDNLEKYDIKDHTYIFKGTSWEMAKCFLNDYIDICLIDASHIYADVKKDITAFLPKVKKGGFICGHDYDRHVEDRVGKFTQEELENDFVNFAHCGVVQAVYDEFGYTDTLPDTTIWIKRV